MQQVVKPVVAHFTGSYDPIVKLWANDELAPHPQVNAPAYPS